MEQKYLSLLKDIQKIPELTEEYRLCGIGFRGSRLYNLTVDESDLDLTILYFPTIENALKIDVKKYEKEINFQNKYFGTCEGKLVDIRKYFKNIRKKFIYTVLNNYGFTYYEEKLFEETGIRLYEYLGFPTLKEVFMELDKTLPYLLQTSPENQFHIFKNQLKNRYKNTIFFHNEPQKVVKNICYFEYMKAIFEKMLKGEPLGELLQLQESSEFQHIRLNGQKSIEEFKGKNYEVYLETFDTLEEEFIESCNKTRKYSSEYEKSFFEEMEHLVITEGFLKYFRAQ